MKGQSRRFFEGEQSFSLADSDGTATKDNVKIGDIVDSLVTCPKDIANFEMDCGDSGLTCHSNEKNLVMNEKPISYTCSGTDGMRLEALIGAEWKAGPLTCEGKEWKVEGNPAEKIHCVTGVVVSSSPSTASDSNNFVYFGVPAIALCLIVIVGLLVYFCFLKKAGGGGRITTAIKVSPKSMQFNMDAGRLTSSFTVRNAGKDKLTFAMNEPADSQFNAEPSMFVLGHRESKRVTVTFTSDDEAPKPGFLFYTASAMVTDDKANSDSAACKVACEFP